MFQLEYVNSSLKVPFLEGPNRYLPSPFDSRNELSGLNIGKFFSRALNVKGIVKKAPRILAGAASGYLMGGYGGNWQQGLAAAAAGGLTASIAKRTAGTSLFQDIYRGGLYGLIGGGVAGAARVAVTGSGQGAGLVGRGWNYIQSTFFGPKATVQYAAPIGPTLPKQGAIDTRMYGITPDPSQYKTNETLPVATSSGSLWSNGWSTTSKILTNALPLATPVLGYMSAEEQMKAAQEAQNVSDAVSQGMMGEGAMGFPPGGSTPYLPNSYSNVPTGVSSDISSGGGGENGGGGGAGMSPGYAPLTPTATEQSQTQEVGPVSMMPEWVMPVGIGASVLLVGWLVFK